MPPSTRGRRSAAKDTLARIRANLGADLVVLGSYLALGAKSRGQLRLDLRIQDAATGETIAQEKEEGTEGQIFGLVARAGARVRECLGLTALSPTEALGVKSSLPKDPEAARLYAEGLAKVRFFDAQGALPLLQNAVAKEPAFPLAHTALSSAYEVLGYDAKASEEAKKAVDLSGGLPREERLFVEARYQQTVRN